MRPELARIERIEQYIMNQLSAEDRLVFEQEIGTDPNLNTEVSAQREVMEVVQYLGLKTSAKNAYTSFLRRRWIKRIGISLVILVTMAALTYVFLTYPSGNKEGQTQGEVEFQAFDSFSVPEGDTLAYAANDELDQQLFTLDQRHDTIIETNGGIVLYVPERAFDTELDEVNVVVQEALTPLDILTSGLSTETVGGEALETGGMFYVDAFSENGRADLVKELTVDIPSRADRNGMMLYEGAANAAGELAWQNPQPLTRPLVSTEITDLDFYPPGYEKEMIRRGFENGTFQDSVYYSFAAEPCFYTTVIEESVPLERIELIGTENNVNSEEQSVSGNTGTANPGLLFMPLPPQNDFSQTDSVDAELMDDLLDEMWDVSQCGVNPAAVQAIWNEKFNGTNLATRAFEERMTAIHSTCRTDILDLYVSLLDEELSVADQKAADRLSGSERQRFQAFANEGFGRVEITSEAGKALNAYYQKKEEMLTEGIQRTYNDYWGEQAELDQKRNAEDDSASDRSAQRKTVLSQAELTFNTEKVYGELGMNIPNQEVRRPIQFPNAMQYDEIPGSAEIPRRRPITNGIRFRGRVNQLGWRNVDCLMSVSTNRTSVKIKGNGRKTEISYTPWTGSVSGLRSDDGYTVYLVPKAFHSFVKLPVEKGQVNYRLNDALNYSVVAFGWKDDLFYSANYYINPGQATIELEETDYEEWSESIAAQYRSLNDIGTEISYEKYLREDNARVNSNKAKRSLRNALYPIVFPCGYYEE